MSNSLFNYKNRIYWFNQENHKKNSYYYVCSKKKTIKCSGSISIKDNEVISSNDSHNCIPLSDYEVTIEIRFNDLKASLCNSAVLDPCDLWKNFHKNLNLVDNIPSEFVDMLVEPWSKVKRQLQRIQKDAHNLPTLHRNFIEFEKLTGDYSLTTDKESFLRYDSIIDRRDNRIMIFTSNRLLE